VVLLVVADLAASAEPLEELLDEPVAAGLLAPQLRDIRDVFRIPLDRRVGDGERGVPGPEGDLEPGLPVVVVDYGDALEDRVERREPLLAVDDQESGH
jgi:hypothetical protein